MSRPGILVLSAQHLCRNPRVLKEATTLGLAGYAVTVLTIASSAQYARLDDELAQGLPFQRLILDQTRGGRGNRAANFLTRLRTWGARKLCRHLGLESPQSLGPASALLRAARACPADLTIAHTEIPLWATKHLIYDGRRVAVDLEDWYSQDLLPVDRRNRPLRLLRQAEDFALNRAAYVSVTSNSMADALVSAYRRPRPVVVRNSFPLPRQSRTDHPASSEPPALIWFSQTIGPGRGLEKFFAAWSLTKAPSQVCLLGEERPDYTRALLARIAPDRRKFIHVLPPVPPPDLPAKLAGFDLGLALEPDEPPNKDHTISNKVFQYLGAGLALAATDTSGQREVLSAAPDSGLLLSRDTKAQAAQLDELLGDPARLRACQLAARAAAEREFCWEKESSHLLAAVARALALPPAAT